MVRQAREMIARGGPIGRRLDFLAQEFMREANTLCSKSVSLPLTSVGLASPAAELLRSAISNRPGRHRRRCAHRS